MRSSNATLSPNRRQGDEKFQCTLPPVTVVRRVRIYRFVLGVEEELMYSFEETENKSDYAAKVHWSHDFTVLHVIIHSHLHKKMKLYCRVSEGNILP